MMKNITALFFLLILSLCVIAQQDHSLYFAASRLDYYTSEDEGEILVYVPESKKELKISIGLVFESQPLAQGFPVSSSGVTTVPFKMELLREGQNEITVSFNENNKWIDSRKVYITIRPDRENAVKIDRATGGLFTGGMPLIPYGLQAPFPVSPRFPEQVASQGYNYITPGFVINNKTMKARQSFMNSCADHGLRVNYDLSGIFISGGGTGVAPESVSIRDRLEILRSEVEKLRDHPALLSWQIADDHNRQNIAAGDLLAAYNLIKEVDPYHPVIVFVSDAGMADQYLNVTNILFTEFQPVIGENGGAEVDFDLTLQNDFYHQRPVWAVIGAPANDDWQGPLSSREIRASVYMAFISGFSGIQFYTRPGQGYFANYPLIDPECSSLAKEIAELTPDITSPYHIPEVASDSPSVHARAWNRLGLVTIIAVNDKNQPLDFNIKMEDSDISVLTDVLFEGRKVEMTKSSIHDIIDGYGTRVYRFDARNKPDRVKGFIPGNLTIDPGFEDISRPGISLAYNIQGSAGPGCSYFIDSRRYLEGGHSLRINNSVAKPGGRLGFSIPELPSGRSYTISVMARTGDSPNKPAGKKGGSVQFRLGLGSVEEVFECTDTWQKYEINVILSGEQDESTGNPMPWIEMAGKGTAWFDLMQLNPSAAPASSN